jgi:hypothetical protein
MKKAAMARAAAETGRKADGGRMVSELWRTADRLCSALLGKVRLCSPFEKNIFSPQIYADAHRWKQPMAAKRGGRRRMRGGTWSLVICHLQISRERVSLQWFRQVEWFEWPPSNGENCGVGPQNQGLPRVCGKSRLSTLFEETPVTAGGTNNGSPPPKLSYLWQSKFG